MRGERSATHQRGRIDEDPTTKTTFFITNITDRITGSQLWDVFQPHVNVTDAWVPRWKAINGRVFNFVRCEKIRNPSLLLPSLNKITLVRRRLVVSLALFDRYHRRINYDNKHHANTNPADKGKSIDAEEAPRPAVGNVWNKNQSVGLKAKIAFDDVGVRKCIFLGSDLSHHFLILGVWTTRKQLKIVTANVLLSQSR